MANFSTFKTLQNLDLCFNKLGLDGGKAVAEALGLNEAKKKAEEPEEIEEEIDLEAFETGKKNK